MTPSVKIDVLDRLSETDAQGVRTVLDSATAADGTAPVGESVLLTFSSGGSGQHLLVRDEAGSVVGYAHAESGPDPDVVEAEAVIAPPNRGHGLGRALLEQLTEGGRKARIWSHGDHPAARALGARLGYRIVRELQQLRRPVAGLTPGDLPEPVLPAGVVLRTFRPGEDDADWLRVNARAFSWHPEQGRMTQADLDARMAEPWFDPAGFFVAEADGRMIGFHWTKVHPEGPGEVYAVGVDPDRHGGGLGTALTLAGLRHLAGLGLDTVLLYVEADNGAALKVYHRLGFTLFAVDVVHEGPYQEH